MSKKVQLVTNAPGGVIAEDVEIRNIQAEQASAKMSLDVQQEIEKQQREADRRAMAQQQQERSAEDQRMADEAEQRHQAELKVPLSEAEREERDRLEKMAMGSGNMDPFNMYRLRDLRIRSQIV